MVESLCCFAFLCRPQRINDCLWVYAMKVEVDLDDLETIIFATSVIKQLESALQARKSDPFVKPHLEYTKASEALTQAMNYAKRSANNDTAVQWDGALTDKETELLKEFVASNVFEITSDFRLKTKEVDSLAAKGCIRIGTLCAGAVWPGESKADLKPVEGFALAITQRGKDKLAKLLANAKS